MKLAYSESFIPDQSAGFRGNAENRAGKNTADAENRAGKNNADAENRAGSDAGGRSA